MSRAEQERGLLADPDDDDVDDHEAPERVWESRAVRWSALSGALLLAGFLARVSDGLRTGVSGS